MLLDEGINISSWSVTANTDMNKRNWVTALSNLSAATVKVENIESLIDKKCHFIGQ